MKILVKEPTDEEYEKNDCRDYLIISVNGKEVVNVYDGEPEDNSLNCYSIVNLMKKAFKAGKAGESLVIID